VTRHNIKASPVNGFRSWNKNLTFEDNGYKIHFRRWVSLQLTIKYAAKLGYTKETWDADAAIPYDSKTFFQCTDEEKQAAMFLGLNPIDKKLNVWWADLDKATKDHAIALGWSEEKWDDDWEIYHLPIDKLYWADLDKAQQKAANHFGYTKATWDETFAEEDMKTVR
jgi:hypothetical protein